MPYSEAFTHDELAAILDYDAETGKLWWKSKIASKVVVGQEAGSVHATRTGRNGVKVFYRYIRVRGRSVPAARVAWLLHYGEWPMAKLRFKDDDTMNLRIENLEMANSVTTVLDPAGVEHRKAYLRAHREAHPMEWKDSHLRNAFGISLAEYGQMLVAQGGKCAICDQEETATRSGSVKALQVDHDHKTGKVRGLLCSDCNTGIGKMKENREALIAAIKYLDKHSGRDSPATKLTVIDGSDT